MVLTMMDTRYSRETSTSFWRILLETTTVTSPGRASVLSLLRLFWKIVDPVVSAPNHFSAAAAILPEQECFPVDTNSSEVVTVNGTYSEERAFDPNQDYPNGGWFQLGSITWPKDADPNKLEKVSPTSVSSRHFDQNTGSSGLPLHWEVADEQWEEKCLGWHWVNNKTNTYDRQIKIRECISKKYTRKCPSGQALFKKVIPPVAGTCLTDRSQTELGKLHLKASGACPDNLVATKDNSRCQCETTC